MIISKSICNDKYYNKYKYLFNYSYNKFHLINKNILFNFVLQDEFGGNKICNIKMKYSFYEAFYNNIIQKKNIISYPGFDFKYFIILKYLNINKSYLVIANNNSIILNNYNNIHIKYKCKIDTILYTDANYSDEIILKFMSNYKDNINSGVIYSSLLKSVYLQFIKNLKNNIEKNDILIPKTKYYLISCHLGYLYTLSLTSSFKMILEIPNIISTIAIALKNIAKDGTLLLFWTIVNVNIPIIKKILSLLSYGFKTVEIIDNDVNQNLLIGVPEYYIKCSGYKDNISNELINKLLDIVIESIEYTYERCFILDYYDDYTEKHPNHSLFYNKTNETHKKKSRKLTKKYSLQLSTSSLSSSSSSLTRKLSNHTNTSQYKIHNKSNIKPIYYIEDINIPELDKIMKDSNLQFKVSVLANKLEGIFIGYFEMVNNLILNSITKDRNGNLKVKKEAILQKDITNLTKLIAMFEHNKLPYNKHALKVLLKKKDEIIDHFYSLDTPVNQKLIHYTDRMSKMLSKSALSHFKSSKTIKKRYDFDNLNDYYAKIKIAHQVKNKLLEDVNFEKYLKKTPKSLQHTIDEFSSGLSDYINNKELTNNKFDKLPIKINNSFLKLWEILDTFKLISHNASKFKVLHLCEAPGQMIVCTRYWVEQNCEKLSANMNNYDWMANSLNPYNYDTRTKYSKKFGNVFSDNYGLIKDNYDKWLWGSDNTGDITNVNNIKSIMNTVKKQWLEENSSNSNKLDLIISDGSISLNMNSLYIQKLDLSQLLTVISCSSIDGNCCVKHYIPYKNINDVGNSSDSIHTTVESSSFFIGYLYMYYSVFDSISLYKPNTSNPNNGEFYVIGKGFKGIDEEQLKNLMSILSQFTLNSCIIEKEHIPETFISQINNFLESMSNINILAIEKQNLLLTCYKNLGEDELENKYEETNKILKCNNFLDEKKIDNMIIPKYKEWIKTFDFV
jgi:23S rRNA U2552 (ribose-2'-O)-methylase RlmE/FtsJ